MNKQEGIFITECPLFLHLSYDFTTFVEYKSINRNYYGEHVG